MGHIWRLLTCILDQAVVEGQLAENPARAFQYPTVRRVKAETLTDQEIEDYLDAAGELRYLPIFSLALEQGLRQRELIALKWSDLDVKIRTLTIHEGRVIECGKLVEHMPSEPSSDCPERRPLPHGSAGRTIPGHPHPPVPGTPHEAGENLSDENLSDTAIPSSSSDPCTWSE